MIFKDYSPKKIAKKLKQVKAFEKKYGANSYTRAWKKWCTSLQYRKNEWQMDKNLESVVQEKKVVLMLHVEC